MKIARLLKNASFVLATMLASQAMAGTVSVTGTPTTAIGTSGDTVTLLGQNQILAFTATPTLFNLQTADFGINYSASQTIPFVLNEDVTINGITRSVAFSFTDFITDASDTLVLAPGAMLQFGSVDFQLMGTSISAGTLGSHLFTVQANISDVPEPASLALFGLALAGLGISRRKAVK